MDSSLVGPIVEEFNLLYETKTFSTPEEKEADTKEQAQKICKQLSEKYNLAFEFVMAIIIVTCYDKLFGKQRR